MTSDKSLCSCCDRPRSMNRWISTFSSTLLILALGILNLPCGHTHIASVIDKDGVPGMPPKSVPRGPTVAPVPSPETLEQLEQIYRDDDRFFNPGEVIRNLLRPSANRAQGLKRVSQFHGNVGNYGLIGSGSDYKHPLPHTWDYEEDGMMDDEEDDKPVFVPFIGARALTNIPQFFEHLKENIEALKLSSSKSNENSDADDDDDDTDELDLDGGHQREKLASRRLKTELLVDENLGRSTITNNKPPGNWKPRAAGTIHYYSPSKTNFLDTERHQSILRRANNYNPAWLYTNLGLGKRRR